MNTTLSSSGIAHNDATPKIKTLPSYPFLVLFIYLPFIVYIHRSKIAPRELDINSIREQLVYYHADLLFFTLLAVLLWLVPTLRRLSFACFTAIYYLTACDWFSWHVQTKSFFFTDLYRALQLLIYYPEFALDLPATFKLKATGLFALPALLYLLLQLDTLARLASMLQRPLNWLSAMSVIAVLFPTPWLISAKYLNQNPITYMLSEQIYDLKLAHIKADRGTMEPVLGHEEPSATTQTTPTHDNVVIFILETAPLPEYPDLADLAAHLDHPWLKNNSTVFTHHYGTYPASDRSHYSILSGLYPPMLTNNQWKTLVQYGNPLAKTLADQGYSTYLFSTAPLAFYDDDLMYTRLGFEHLLEVEMTKSLRTQTASGYEWDRSRLYEADQQLIDLTIDTLTRQQAEHPSQPFLATISPQASHAPFNCPPEQRDDPTACNSDLAKIRTNAQWQFRLLERLIRHLDRQGLLDHTLLVITGDHGIRSAHETPLFQNPNLLQEHTFHIPLMIASSRLGNSPRRLDNYTSHVDIVPSILDLLGMPRESLYFHGRSLFADSPRSIYFIGTGYSPVTGFWRDGHFYMENRSNDLFLASTQMDFTDPAHREGGKGVRKAVTTELLRLEAFLRREQQATPGSQGGREIEGMNQGTSE